MTAEEIATALLRLEAAQDLHSLLDAALGAVRDVRDALNEQLETYEHLVAEAQVQALDDAGHALWRVDCAETREEMAEGLADMPYDEYGVDWDENATDSYVQRAYGDYGRARRAVTVRIGLDPSTHLWWIDEGDDAEREHYGPYATRAQAEAKMAECLAKDESAEEVK